MSYFDRYPVPSNRNSPVNSGSYDFARRKFSPFDYTAAVTANEADLCSKAVFDVLRSKDDVQ